MDNEKDFWHFSWLHLAVTDKRFINFNLKPINCTVSLHMHVLGCMEIDKKKIFIVGNISCILCCPFPCQFSIVWNLLLTARLFESDCFLGLNIWRIMHIVYLRLNLIFQLSLAGLAVCLLWIYFINTLRISPACHLYYNGSMS